MSQVDYLGLLPIFASARETQDQEFSASTILSQLPKTLEAHLLVSDKDWQDLVIKTQASGSNWIYVTMGAGDVYKKSPLLVKSLNG